MIYPCEKHTQILALNCKKQKRHPTGCLFVLVGTTGPLVTNFLRKGPPDPCSQITDLEKVDTGSRP